MTVNPADLTNHQRGDISPDGRHYWDGDVWQWQPLWLTADDAVAVSAQRFGRNAHAAHFLAAGMLNQSWRVETSDGRFVLRVSRAERTWEQVAYEHEVLRRLKPHVDEVVVPVPGVDGATMPCWDEHFVSLFPFVDGMSGVEIDPAGGLMQTMSVLARIHRVSLDHIDLGQRPGFQPFDAAWRSLCHETIPILRRDLADHDSASGMLDALQGEIGQIEVWLGRLPATGRTLIEATIHGDVNPRNLIFRDGSLVAVIDWDECRLDPIAWEVAQVAFTSGGEPGACWNAYLDAGGPLSERDRDLLAALARMGAMMELQWTVGDGRAKPRASTQVGDIVGALARIDEHAM